MKIQRAAVVGAGTMGSGIAQVLSQSGIEVILKDVSPEFVQSGLDKIKAMYASRVKKEVLTEKEAEFLFSHIKGTTSYDDFKQVDLVIEAALEQIEAKKEIFGQLDKICPPQAILATNTSALSISEIAAHTKRPDKIVGMHFFNPAQTMKLVEVIPGLNTSQETVETALELCRNWKKTPVRVDECPGFLVNRLLFPYLNEALYALQDGAASIFQIDEQVVKLGMPMGPFALFDMTGIDVCAHVNQFLYREYGPRFEPAKLIELMSEAGCYGQKKGAGFYLHLKGAPVKSDSPKQENPELAKLVANAAKASAKPEKSLPFDAYRVILPMFNEAIYALQEHVVESCDVDVAMQYGCGMSKGLLTLAEEKGFAWILNQLDTYHAAYGERFRPAWLLRKLVRAGMHDFSQCKQASKKEKVAVR
jgi:3-hydroxyacyl-CoA dehydrogenase